MPTYIGAIETMAQGCANTAMTVHMHSTVHRFIAALGTLAQQRHYCVETVAHGKLCGSWGSEPSLDVPRGKTAPWSAPIATCGCVPSCHRPPITC